MGNALAPYIRGDGIRQGHKIVRRCEECDVPYVGWSDDTITIKGPMPIRLKCDVCAKKYEPKIDEAWIQFIESKCNKNQHNDKTVI
jgi:hypothetical protein